MTTNNIKHYNIKENYAYAHYSFRIPECDRLLIYTKYSAQEKNIYILVNSFCSLENSDKGHSTKNDIT